MARRSPRDAWMGVCLVALAVATTVVGGCRGGRSHEGSLAGNTEDRYEVVLEAGQVVRVEAEQLGVDLVLHLLDPSGREVAQFDSPTGPRGTEILEAEAGTSGIYEVVVEDPVAHDRTGRYRLWISDPRVPDEAGRRAVLARAEAYFLSIGTPSLAERFDEPEGKLRHQLSLWREVGSPEWQAFTLIELGEWLRDQGRLDMAEASLAEAVRLSAIHENPRTLGDALRNLGRLRQSQARHAESAELCGRAVEVWEQDGDEAVRRDKQAASHHCRALALRRLGRLRDALGSLDQAEALWRAGGQAPRLARVLEARSTLLLDLGDYPASLAACYDGLGLAQTARLGRLVASLQVNCATTEWKMGRYQAALDRFQAVIPLAQALGEQRLERLAALNLSIISGQLGDLDAAIDRFEELLASLDEQEDGELALSVKARLGEAYVYRGQVDRGLNLLQSVAALDDGSGFQRAPAQAISKLGRAYLERDEPERALAPLRRAEELWTEAGTPWMVVQVLSDLGLALERTGRPAEAEAVWRRVLGLTADGLDPRARSATLDHLASLERERGHYDGALAYLEEALALDETLRSALLSPRLREELLASRRVRYEKAVGLHARRLDRAEAGEGRAPEPEADLASAFALAERSRARVLAELLAESRIEAQETSSPLRARAADLERQLSQVQRQLLEGLGEEEGTEEAVGNLRRRQTELLEAIEAVGVELRRADPRYASLRYPDPPSLDELRARLGPETAFLEYLVGREEAFVFVVTRETAGLVSLGPSAEIRRLAESFAALLRTPRSPARRLVAMGRSLHAAVLDPVAELVGESRELLIAPDDALYLVPFEALLTEAAPASARLADLPFLLRRARVSYVPSAAVLIALDQAPRSGPAARRELTARDVVVFADPDYTSLGRASGAGGEPAQSTYARLPQTRVEADSLVSLLPPGQVEVYLGSRATEAALKGASSVRRAGVLHIAAHGILDGEDARAIGVLLSRSEPSDDDGLVQLHEVFGLDLTAELVVLSACESALGQRVPGEGLVGLSRGFFYAGARKLVASLWQVRDTSTADLMRRFYRELWAGQATSASLREAKLELIQEGRFAHPSHWAAFVLIGSQGAVGV